MPGIIVSIGADSSKFKGELKEVEKVAKGLGANLKSAVDGGHGGAKAGVVREVLVMLREVGRGNFSGLAGSATILAGRMGLVSRIMPLILNPVTWIGTGLVAAGFAAFKLANYTTDMFTTTKNLNLEVNKFASQLGKINAAADVQNSLNKAIQRSGELYDSASESAKRSLSNSEEYFNHLEKMNAFEKDPAKKSAQEFAILQGRHSAGLEIRRKEQQGLASSSAAKAKEATRLLQSVPSAEVDSENERNARLRLENAQKEFDDYQKEHPQQREVSPRLQQSQSWKDREEAREMRRKNLADANKGLTDTLRNAYSHGQVRKQGEQLSGEADAAGASANALGKSIGDITKQNRVNERNSLQEAIAAASETKVMPFGHVNNLQSIGGGYVRENPGVTVANKQLAVLQAMLRKMGAPGVGFQPAPGRTNFGGIH